MMITIAITVWGNRISPVFESAQNLLIARIQNGKVIEKKYETIDCQSLQVVEQFEKSGVNVLICGAISDTAAGMITGSKITLIPFVTGNAARVLDLYVSDEPVPPSFFMPGCSRNRQLKKLKSCGI